MYEVTYFCSIFIKINLNFSIVLSFISEPKLINSKLCFEIKKKKKNQSIDIVNRVIRKMLVVKYPIIATTYFIYNDFKKF